MSKTRSGSSVKMSFTATFSAQVFEWEHIRLNNTLRIEIKPSIAIEQAIITGVKLWENNDTIIVTPEGTGEMMNPLLVFTSNSHGKFIGRCSVEQLPLLLTNFQVGNRFSVDGPWSAKLIDLYSLYQPIVDRRILDLKGNPVMQTYEAQIIRAIYTRIERML